MHKIYTNADEGTEAVITEGNGKFPYRVIFRDTDADDTVTVKFGSLDFCYAQAILFVGDSAPKIHIS